MLCRRLTSSSSRRLASSKARGGTSSADAAVCAERERVRSLHPRVLFSGIQPTGVPHLGNYFGVIEPWLQFQKSEPRESSMILTVVDQHAISTGPQPPAQLRANTRQMAAALLACGVDPNRTLLFRQSDVPEIAQLSWILGSLQTLTKLQRLPQYKEKSAKFSSGAVPVGLLTYPLLQAADVLAFKGTHVPVGEDQSQHMNLLSDLAYHFNKHFDTDFFPIPEQVTRSVSARIRSLRDPNSKMSKSEKSARSRIDLSDSRSSIEEKCRRAMSDSIPGIVHCRESRPAVSNLLELLAAVRSVPLSTVVEEAAEWDVVELKRQLAERVEERIGPVRERMEQIEREGGVDEILAESGLRARRIAEENVKQVKHIIGFL